MNIRNIRKSGRSEDAKLDTEAEGPTILANLTHK